MEGTIAWPGLTRCKRDEITARSAVPLVNARYIEWRSRTSAHWSRVSQRCRPDSSNISTLKSWLQRTKQTMLLRDCRAQDTMTFTYTWRDSRVSTNIHGTTVWVKKIPPAVFWHIFPKRMGIFKSVFRHLLHVPSYTRLQIFIQLSPTLTKLCHTERGHPTNFYILREV